MTRGTVLFLITLALGAAGVRPLRAQSLTGTPLAPSPYPDARIVGRGILRVSFEPEYISYDEVFDTSGDRRPLGWALTSDSAGSNLFPTALSGEVGARTLSGITDYRLSIGSTLTTRQADIRRFPLNFELGLGKRLSLTASLPIVTTRTQITVTLDSATANAGLNPALASAGLAEVASLIQAYNAAADQVDAQIAAGSYGCPSSAACDAARDAVTRTRAATAALSQMTGVQSDGALAEAPPPFVPRASSVAGQAIQATLAQLAQDLAALGVTPASTNLPLPAAALDTAGLQGLLTGSEAGFSAEPLAFVKYRQKIGDAELGARWGILQAPSVRAVLAGRVRLPTGQRDRPDQFVDFGSGDRQTDVVGSLEAVFSPARFVALAVEVSYTMQLADQTAMRVAPPDQPLNVMQSLSDVNRHLGSVMRVSAYPSVRLSDIFTAYASVHYFRKAADTYERVGGDPQFVAAPPDWYFPASVLGEQTKIEQVSFGAGVHYDAESAKSSRLPIQAGIDYRAAFRGSGGQTPADVRLNFYLRLYYRLWGR